jgi:hypothetical protein
VIDPAGYGKIEAGVRIERMQFKRKLRRVSDE